MTHILLSLSELVIYVNLPCKIVSVNFCFLNARNWFWVLLVEGIVNCNGLYKFWVNRASQIIEYWINQLLLHSGPMEFC